MKTFLLEKVNIRKLYLILLLGVFTYVLLMLLLIILIKLIFPDFDNVNLFIVISALVFGNYIYKFSYSKSSEKIQIRLNDTKIIIEEIEILFDNIKSLKFKGARFNYYPKLIIGLTDSKEISFRISKNNGFDELILGLKSNPKAKSIFSF